MTQFSDIFEVCYPRGINTFINENTYTISMEESPQLHIMFPLFFTGLLISSISSIIASSINLSWNPENTLMIPAIVTSAVLTLLFLIFTIIAWIETSQVHKSIPALAHGPLGSTKINIVFSQFINEAEVWEIIMTVIGAFLIVIGMGTLFVGDGSGSMIFGIILIGIAYYSFNEREKLRSSLRVVLPNYENIHAKQLGKLVNKSSDDVLKAVTYLIAYESFPARIDPDKKMIFFTGTLGVPVRRPEYEYDEVQAVQQAPPQEAFTKQPVKKEEAPAYEGSTGIICAYCGEEAITNDAKFCIGCGASITAAK